MRRRNQRLAIVTSICAFVDSQAVCRALVTPLLVKSLQFVGLPFSYPVRQSNTMEI